MFNENVINVLSQINGITNSVILKYPETVAVSEAQDMMVFFNVAELDSDQFSDIALKDSLGDFLNLVKLFPNNRSIDLSENTINISNGDTSSVFITDNIALMDAYDKSPEQFVKTEEVPSVVEFDLLVDDLKKIKSATGVFKDLSEVIFSAQDSDVKISLGATNKFNAKSNTFGISKSAQSSKEFEIKIPVENNEKIQSQMLGEGEILINDILIESLSNNFVLRSLVASTLLTDEEASLLENGGSYLFEEIQEINNETIIKKLYERVLQRVEETPDHFGWLLDVIGEEYKRDYKKEYKNYHGKPKQRKERAARTAARELMIKKGRVKKGDGKDIDHKKPLRNGGSKGINNLRIRDKSENRSDNGHKKGETQKKDSWK